MPDGLTDAGEVTASAPDAAPDILTDADLRAVADAAVSGAAGYLDTQAQSAVDDAATAAADAAVGRVAREVKAAVRSDSGTVATVQVDAGQWDGMRDAMRANLAVSMIALVVDAALMGLLLWYVAVRRVL